MYGLIHRLRAYSEWFTRLMRFRFRAQGFRALGSRVFTTFKSLGFGVQGVDPHPDSPTPEVGREYTFTAWLGTVVLR